jgi:hypothetical protein
VPVVSVVACVPAAGVVVPAPDLGVAVAFGVAAGAGWCVTASIVQVASARGPVGSGPVGVVAGGQLGVWAGAWVMW